MVVEPFKQVLGYILPARAHVDSGQLQPGQQRDGTDLVLRVVFGHAPDPLVVQRQYLLSLAQLQREQSQVPPVVGQHERVQPGPGGACRLHEVKPLLQAALGQQHMGQRMVGPGLPVQHGDGSPRRRLGRLQQVALLPGKGCHAVHVRHICAGAQPVQGQTQHAGGIACIEQVVLAELDRCEVAREFLGLLLVQVDGLRQVARCPGAHCGHKTTFSGADGLISQSSLGPRDEGRSIRPGLTGLGKQVQRRAAGLYQRAAVGLGHLQDIDHPCLTSDQALNKVVHRLQAGRGIQRDHIAQAVALHGWCCWFGSGRRWPRPRALWPPQSLKCMRNLQHA